ncbi:MAG: chemotaxis protein [Rhizobiales bacterium]|nr:chemotaxis protein [Hyphomicrobiales bacterium]
MLTIGYCYTLNRRLERLRADEQSLKGTIAELITATEIAERAVGELKRAAQENDGTLGERVRAAERYCVELDRQVAAGDVVLTRLSRVVVAARSLQDVPSAVTAPDPKAVAAAARSFSDRLRDRAGAKAA